MLVACEFSGIVRDAFAARGHRAWSCDLLDSERPGLHLRMDVRKLLRAPWDLLIAHPPCQYLARSGARWWSALENGEQEAALEFVQTLLDAPIPRIALENPPGAIGTRIRPADQYVQPWWFGHGETKMTGLWLKNLPLLQPTNEVDGRKPAVHYAAPGPQRWKNRSRTCAGLADAMAEQWGRADL